MKAVSDLKLYSVIRKVKELLGLKIDKEMIKIVTDLPADAPDGTIFLLILEDENDGNAQQ